MEYRFTSFLKARLMCSLTYPSGGIPYFFNDIRKLITSYLYLDSSVLYLMQTIDASVSPYLWALGVDDVIIIMSI